MTRSKTFAIALVALSLFAAGCASGGMKKPMVFTDRNNHIPADIPSQFLDRYFFLIDKEGKEFKKLLTDEERQVFIDKFWLERDTDPATPGNEYKEEIDERIDDITNERFFSGVNVTGLLFRSNGGFRGDMAKVYLLHGEPDAIDIIESQSQLFVPMMLWIYSNPENGEILYAFLFYKKGSVGTFKLFPQDSYRMDRCAAFYEVATLRMYSYPVGGMQSCPDDLYRVYEEIYRSTGKGGILDGNIFIWALFNFSQDNSILQVEALSPPKPASEIAKQSKARVTGEAPKLVGIAGIDYILASCDTCNSMIPAELSLGERFTISGPWKNFDWAIKGEYLELSLKYRIILEDFNISQPIVLEGITVRGVNKKSTEENPEAVIIADIIDPIQIAAIPPGTYHVSVYVKNTLTQKYNAWDKEFIKK